MNRLIRSTIPLALAAFLLTGCAFEREWQAARGYAWPENELAGCWEGSWHSDWNGHEGGLRAIITQQGDNYYNAHFKATYAVVIPFEFEIPLLVTDDGQVYTFEGDADLGLLAGGNYVYCGTASGGNFHSTYEAENGDHGTFSMVKVVPGAEWTEPGCDADCCPHKE